MHIQTAELKPIALRPELIKVAGDVVVGVLLSQLYYWCVEPDKKGKSKLRVEREGHKWAAKPMKELLAETGLTRKQYLRAIKVLQDKGIVEIRLFRSRFHEGLVVNHWRVDTACLTRLQNEIPKGDNRMCPKGTTGSTVWVQPISTETLTENTSSKTGVTSTPKIEQLPTTQVQVEDMKLEDILKERKTGKKSQTLDGFWQERRNLVTQKFSVPLTAKEKGQLKAIANRLGVRTREVVDWALHNWPKFAEEAKLDAGVATRPMTPHIGFLLKHCDVAMNLYLQSIAKTPVSLPQETLIVKPSTPVQASNEGKASIAEVEQLLENLKE